MDRPMYLDLKIPYDEPRKMITPLAEKTSMELYKSKRLKREQTRKNRNI